jgi:hypothetical protein
MHNDKVGEVLSHPSKYPCAPYRVNRTVYADARTRHAGQEGNDPLRRSGAHQAIAGEGENLNSAQESCLTPVRVAKITFFAATGIAIRASTGRLPEQGVIEGS